MTKHHDCPLCNEPTDGRGVLVHAACVWETAGGHVVSPWVSDPIDGREVDVAALVVDLAAATAMLAVLLDAPGVEDIQRARDLLDDLNQKEIGGRPLAQAACNCSSRNGEPHAFDCNYRIAAWVGGGTK